MGNCHSCFNLLCTESNQSLPIDTPFIISSSPPSSLSGGGFGKGSIDLGGLEVRQVSTFTKLWSAAGNGGATFFFPSFIPSGFYPLGAYAQPNKNRFFGRLLVARDNIAGDGGGTVALAAPTDFTLIWSSSDGGYFWLPVPPSGYQPVGYLVTTSPEKPSPESLRCVREDFTDQCEEGRVKIWSSGCNGGISIHELVPIAGGREAPGLPPGTFIARTAAGENPHSVRCLKNKKFSLSAAMPDLSQINAVIKAYAPVIYFHPDETYLPSSVNWLFENGALLHSKSDPTNPARLKSGGANLPQGGTNDGAYWIDLPAGEEKERVKRGELSTATAYVHVKKMLGGTATDFVFWLFYPFNGPARLKIGALTTGLGKIGEHVGDWEHLTLRVSNFDGELRKVYFSEHSRGEWFDSPEVEFDGEGRNKPVAYASLNGHSFYAKEGLVLQGSEEVGIGIRNDTKKGKKMDAGERFEVVAAEDLPAVEDVVVGPGWVEYMREWGPKVSYNVGEEVEKLEGLLPEKWRKVARKVVEALPPELLGEEGPTGPKVKASWCQKRRKL
ncbi:uncharacterized protein LOC110029284 isoform X2 [Phalaenopsis equestris]|uniref:uncharacterized protein LOC110029284 isoform X1 n=1 Tax=Phalaenopsis equestris TaxID=78828 RepID=UPI0009E3A058|nr:uncharacterized protein LOC110029284 isoform X1 [Phalaenopsis equestris]XP_020587170.1 uncharacterized protein LOC110029284 isoform X2 [Phalaenopsis equestris]